MRLEHQVFLELEELCKSPGFAYVLAYLCHRENAVTYGEKLEPSNFNHQFSERHLVRTELCTLIGLLCKTPLMLVMPHPDNMQDMINRAEALLEEMHQILAAPLRGTVDGRSE